MRITNEILGVRGFKKDEVCKLRGCIADKHPSCNSKLSCRWWTTDFVTEHPEHSTFRSVTKSSIVSVLVHANRFPIDWFAIFLSSLTDTPFVEAQYRRLIAKNGNSPTRFIEGDYQQKHGSREAI